MAEAAMKHINRAAQHASVEGTPLGKTLGERIRAHNDAEHTETRLVPSQVMWGRRLRRGLPSQRPARVVIDVEAMRERDRAAKLRKKTTEDRRRRAKDTTIMVGDKVVLERAVKRKGDTHFGHEEWTVKEMRRGDLTLQLPDGTETRRDVSKVKKLPPVTVTSDLATDAQGGGAGSAGDQRLPSTSLTSAAGAGGGNLLQDRQEDELGGSEGERPPSPFLTSASWTPDIRSDRSSQAVIPQATTELQQPAPTMVRPKRNIQKPARLKDCVLNKVQNMDNN
jgi:hypothetical protein